MKELWTKDEAEFRGKYYDFPPVISFPRPLQQPHPPIYVGAMTAGNVLRRVVTYGDGWMPWLYTPDQIRDGHAMLDKLAPEFGRDPRSIEVVAAPVAAEPNVIKQYEDAGADGIVVFVMPAAEPRLSGSAFRCSLMRVPEATATTISPRGRTCSGHPRLRKSQCRPPESRG
jgi:Luciferase-like monooxygenase